jgi:hypothetical protein
MHIFNFILMLAAFGAVSYVQNAAFTWSSRSRNSGDPSYHRRAAYSSNFVYYVTNALMTIYIVNNKQWWALVLQGIVYTISTAEGSVAMMVRLLKKESGKNAVGAGKYAQITKEEWEGVKQWIHTLRLGVVSADKAANTAIQMSASVLTGYRPAPTVGIPSSASGGL